MTAFHRTVSRLSDILFNVALVCGGLMMLHVTADVISRTVFRHPLIGTGEITATYYMIAVAFLPLGLVTIEDKHVTADLFVSGLSKRVRAVLAVVVDLLSILYVSLFVWQSALSAISRTERGEVWEIYGGYLPVWPARWFLPLAGATMVLALFSRMLARLTGPAGSHKGTI